MMPDYPLETNSNFHFCRESDSDLLRRLAVDRFASMAEEKVFSDVVEDLPPGLLVDISKQMKQY
jgi:hypothetical protein